MADDDSYEVASPFKMEMLARMLTPETLALGNLGSLPEQSLVLFKKKRATRDYTGFVDAVSMAPAVSLQNRGVKVFNGLVNSPVGNQATFLQGKMDEQLKYLSDANHGPLAQQLLLTETLPQHEYELNIGNIADCLCADSPAVRRDAVSRLERLILVTSHKTIKAFKVQLLVVARKTYDVIYGETSEAVMEDEEHVRRCGQLHMVAVSAVLCHPTSKPSIIEFRPFMSPQKLTKKNVIGYDVKKEAFKLHNVFYEHLERFLKDSTSKMAAPATSDLRKFMDAKFCEQMSSLFWTLNQIAEEGEWSNSTTKLLAGLKEVCDVIAREGRRRRLEKAGMEALLIRGLVILLTSTFAKVRQAVGEDTPNHQVTAAELLSSMAQSMARSMAQSTAQRVHSLQTSQLMSLLSTVAYHESPEVCSIIAELLDSLRQPDVHTAVDFLEASLGMADFHVDRPERPEDVCQWHLLKGHFGHQPVDCRVMVHAASCKAKTPLSSKCVVQDREELRREKHNIEMLVKLSSVGRSVDAPGRANVRKHLVQLFAFQNSPFFFHAMESLKGQRLLEHLVNHRAAHRWLSTSVLVRVMYYVISGLKFLASQHIASREITSYYLLVGGRSRRGGAASEKTDVLAMDDFTIKLTSLALAHQYRDEKGSAVPVDTQGPIPLLWTPPEGLLRGEYSELSMVYSAGCVMYELWTHGCQPFATYQKSTADTVRMMLLRPESTPLIRWPCIPEDVHSVMRECTATEPFSRPNLASLKKTFQTMHNRKSRLGPVEAFNEEGQERDYPSFSIDQVRRKHVPEVGIPPDIQQVIRDHQRTEQNDEEVAYRNLDKSRWDDYTDDFPEGTDREVDSPDWLDFAYEEDFTSVREKLPPGFDKKELELLDKRSAQEQGHLQGVTDWLQDEQNRPTLEHLSQDHIVHERRYKPAWTLLDVASRGLLTFTPDGYFCMQMDRVVHVLLSVARALEAVHNAHWLHRDIRASNILIDCQSGEATLVRLGRMCQIGSPSDCVVGEPFEDSWRWLGPEVLSDGKYTRENDVFMFGTCIWETFWCREVTENNPSATEMNYLPYTDHPKDNILTLVRQKKPLTKPLACPHWLYQLSVNCRDPDPAMRPLTSDIILTLEKELPVKPDLSVQFLQHPKLFAAAYERCVSEGGTEVPELPARFVTKHARSYHVSRGVNGRQKLTTPAEKQRPLTSGSRKPDPKSTVQEGAAIAAAGRDYPTPYELVQQAAKLDHDYLSLIPEEDAPVPASPLKPAEKKVRANQRRASEGMRPTQSADLLSKPQARSLKESDLPSGPGQKASKMKVFKKIRNPFAERALPPVPAEAEDKGNGRPFGDQDSAFFHLYEEI